MMKILTSEYSVEALRQLGTAECRGVEGTGLKMSYVFDNIEIDSIKYDCVYVTETVELSNIGFELTIDDLSELNSYIKDIDKYYGKHSHDREDTYTWKSDNGLTPEIWIHKNESPYKVNISVNKQE